MTVGLNPERTQPPEDISDALEAVAEEMDSRRTLRESVREAVRTVKLFLVISWHHLRGRGR